MRGKAKSGSGTRHTTELDKIKNLRSGSPCNGSDYSNVNLGRLLPTG